MKTQNVRTGSIRAQLVAGLLSVSALVSIAQVTPTQGGPGPKEEEEEVIALSPFEVGSLGLTPGGFKNVNYARELLKYGMLPFPNEFTVEGLFSEYDLSLSNRKASKLVEVRGAAMPASIVGQPEITHLVQIGFASSLRLETFKRDPLFLTIVLDVSGSMEDYLDEVKESVHVMLDKLRDGDAVSIVTFSESARIIQTPTLFKSWKGSPIREKVKAIKVEGGTNIATGLRVGFEIAQSKPAGFSGRSRVVLVTDAMPNIDATSPEEFMSQATEASLKGVGLTTIGLNIVFDSDFVRKVSSVSGGNAYWFADAGQMKETLDRDFDFITTEVAFDFELHLAPAHGFRVSGVYGLPEDSYARTDDGGILIDIPTLFLSRNKGAIYLALTADGPIGDNAGSVGRAELSYVPYGTRTLESEVVDIALFDFRGAPKGLKRGLVLISEFEAVKAAASAFYRDDRISLASQLVQTASHQMNQLADRELEAERAFLARVNEFLSAASREPPINSSLFASRAKIAPLTGVWEAVVDGDPEPNRWMFLPSGKVVVVNGRENARFSMVTDWNRKGVGSRRANRLTFGIDGDGLFLSGHEQMIRLRRVVEKAEPEAVKS